MRFADHPDHVIWHEPACCSGCGAGLAGARVTGAERRQVTEIPPVRAEVTEHQLVERECGGCGTRTRGQPPAGVNAPVQYGPRAAALGAYLWHGQFLSRDRACAALAEVFGCAPSAGALAAMTRKIAGIISPALEAITRALIAAEVTHFDETGFRVAGKLAWVHSASSGKYVLVSVHEKRGIEGMDAAGVLPSFAGIACHDAWAPYDRYEPAGHALCNAHLLRELIAVTETGTADDVIWARQAIDALLELKQRQDLEIASQVQRHLLPHHCPEFATLDCSARCTQAGVLGGDYFDFIRVDDDRTAIAVGDVFQRQPHEAVDERLRLGAADDEPAGAVAKPGRGVRQRCPATAGRDQRPAVRHDSGQQVRHSLLRRLL